MESLHLFLMVVAVSSCVLGICFTAMYYLNKAVDQSER
jgi:hypothetical protein